MLSILQSFVKFCKSGKSTIFLTIYFRSLTHWGPKLQPSLLTGKSGTDIHIDKD